MLLTFPQAKLKSLHEVVVRNRLEQLRKRQRDEALQAQEELLEGVANVASKGKFRPPAIETSVGQQPLEKRAGVGRQGQPGECYCTSHRTKFT